MRVWYGMIHNAVLVHGASFSTLKSGPSMMEHLPVSWRNWGLKMRVILGMMERQLSCVVYSWKFDGLFSNVPLAVLNSISWHAEGKNWEAKNVGFGPAFPSPNQRSSERTRNMSHGSEKDLSPQWHAPMATSQGKECHPWVQMPTSFCVETSRSYLQSTKEDSKRMNLKCASPVPSICLNDLGCCGR